MTGGKDFKVKLLKLRLENAKRDVERLEQELSQATNELEKLP
jgi:hypothetical protein